MILAWENVHPQGQECAPVAVIVKHDVIQVQARVFLVVPCDPPCVIAQQAVLLQKPEHLLLVGNSQQLLPRQRDDLHEKPRPGAALGTQHAFCTMRQRLHSEVFLGANLPSVWNLQ